MINKTSVITLVCAAAFAVGCNKEQTTSEQFDKVGADTKQAAEDVKDYTFAQKDAFVEKMRTQLAEINRELDQLSAKIETSSDAAKAEAKPKLQVLREQTAKVTRQLDDAKNATESTWGDVKVGFNKGYDELKNGFQVARQWVSDKIAP